MTGSRIHKLMEARANWVPDPTPEELDRELKRIMTPDAAIAPEQGSIADLMATAQANAKLSGERLQQAQEVLEAARRQAEQIVAAARDQADEALEQAGQMIRSAREQSEQITSDARRAAKQSITAAQDTSPQLWPKVSVVIPTLNEARNLPHVFAKLPAGLHEVIVVDGNSVDDTVFTARRLRPDTRIVMQNRSGKGNALACGFEAATGDIIAMVDADGSADPAEIPQFVQALLDGADFAKGTRFAAGGGSCDITRIRHLGNRMLSGLVNMLCRTSYSDLCYGYNAFWRRHVPVFGLDAKTDVPAGGGTRLWGDGFEVDALINMRIAQAGLAVTEVPSYEHYRIHGVSNINAARDGWRVLRTILAERYYHHNRRKAQRKLATGDRYAAGRLADLLAGRGDLDGVAQILRVRADAGDGYAAGRLADLLAGRGDLDELRALADAGDGYAARRLADLLAGRGDLDGLRALADAGDGYAAGRLADLLAERGDLDELRARADAGDGYAAVWLAALLAGRGDLDGLRALADAGDGYAAGRLAALLYERGDLNGVTQILRARADAGDGSAAGGLADLLIKQGRGDEAQRLRRWKAMLAA